MVRRTVTGNACVSVTREKRVATGSAPVLWSTLGGPHFPPSPLPLPDGEEGGTWGGWSEKITPHAMVAWVRYVPDEKSGFLIRL